ncbi:MAG TPA: tetratricopeptide repeat protein [Terracidiphilus sp.]|jgi:tetratricopeptide (TPR) repeat protein
MKRILSRLLVLSAAVGLLLLAGSSSQSQTTPADNMGKIHGRVINPTGQPQGGGKVGLSTDGGHTLAFTFPVDSTGSFSGEAKPGTYELVYLAPDTPAGQMVDSIRGIKIVAGVDLEQDDDMSRQEFLDKMTPDQKKQLDDLKKVNAEALKANALIANLNADLKVVGQDKKDIDTASATATQTLGANASKTDIAAKTEEIKTAKYTDIQSLMTKDTTAKPDEALLWNNLAYAQAGLKNYDDAITSYKKALDLETASKKPRMPVIGAANEGLGEIYARTGKVSDANAAFDAAAKADPASAPLFLRNEAVIFYQENNNAAEAAAADEAIKIDPTQPILYYIKGQGLIANATVDPKTNRIILPPDCVAAYQKYLELAPTGPYASEVAGILQQAGEKVSSSYKAPK